MLYADKIFYGGIIATVNDAFDFAEAVAVKDGKILAVGTQDEIFALCSHETEKIDLKGALMLPGIHDSHVHTSDFINNMQALDCSGAETIGQLKELIRTRKETFDGGWLLCSGLGNSVLTQGLTCHDIDDVSGDTPVVLVMWHGHGCAANTAAMEKSGISKDSASPPGGTIERDAEGNPTGILQEASAMQLAFRGMPRLSPREIQRNLEKMQKIMNSMGYTAYTECTAGPANDERESGASGSGCLEAYKMMLDEKSLTCRVSVGFYSGRNGVQSADILREDIEKGAIPISADEDWLSFHMIKIFCDGVHLSYTAWMKNDYLNAPGNHGFSCFGDGTLTDAEQEQALRDIISVAHNAGYQVGIHTIGDKAVQASADAIIAAQNKYPREDCRHCLIHADSLGDLEDFRKCAENGIYISAQPNLADDMYEISIETIGEKAEKLMALREIVDLGIVVAGGSDSIAGEFHDWRYGIRSAISRKSVTGAFFRQDLAISVKEAVQLYTINAAKQEFAENVRGSIEIGKFADFTVIDRNIFEITPDEIIDTQVLMTVVDGNIVYRR